MKRKGFYPLFTTLGLLLIIMVMALNVQWSSDSDSAFGAHIDRLSWLRINHAVENVRYMAVSSLRRLLYDAVSGIGRIPDGQTVNPFLEYSKDEGWEAIMDNISASVSKGFSDSMSSLADYSDDYQNSFSFDSGINVSIGRLSADRIRITEDGDGLLAIVELPMIVSNRYQGWEATMFENNISIPINIRIKDIYERAWDFHDRYEETASWTLTIALYTRAYLAANLLNSGDAKDGDRKASAGLGGAFLKEGHYDFDPIATILFGDLDTIKEFAGNISSVTDLGAIPAANWFMEWSTLSEPSFLPPGYDLSPQESESAARAISGNYILSDAEEGTCEGLAGEDRQNCELLYDKDELGQELKKLREQKELFEGLSSDISGWLKQYSTKKYDNCHDKSSCDDNYDQCKDRAITAEESCECKKKLHKCEDSHAGYGSKRKACEYKQLEELFGTNKPCEHFREKASEMIEGLLDVLPDPNKGQCLGDMRDAKKDAKGLDIDDDIRQEFFNNDKGYGYGEVDDFCSFPAKRLSNLKKILESRLDEALLNEGSCTTKDEGVCLFEGNCGDAGECDVDCEWARCGRGKSGIYSCFANKKTSTKTYSCSKCETDCKDIEHCYRGSDKISYCSCGCMPSIDLLKDINKNLEPLYDYVEKTAGALAETYNSLNDKMETREMADRFMDELDGLSESDTGYDVFSRTEPIYVKYDAGEFSGGKKCYNNPDFEDRKKGICGDSVESVGTYTVQVAAAALGSIFSFGAASGFLDKLVEFFPIIYETEVSYNLTETIIDDANRAMLENLAGDGGELYAYAPLEFEIYRRHSFTIKPATLGRVILFFYMPKEKIIEDMGKILNAMGDCEGEDCG